MNLPFKKPAILFLVNFLKALSLKQKN